MVCIYLLVRFGLLIRHHLLLPQYHALNDLGNADHTGLEALQIFMTAPSFLHNGCNFLTKPTDTLQIKMYICNEVTSKSLPTIRLFYIILYRTVKSKATFSKTHINKYLLGYIPFSENNRYVYCIFGFNTRCIDSEVLKINHLHTNDRMSIFFIKSCSGQIERFCTIISILSC